MFFKQKEYRTGSRKGIIHAAIERLNGLMADGESRYKAKQELRASGEHVWAFSTGKMHSFATRTDYQQHVLHFINWARQEHDINRLDRLDERADELATAYLEYRIANGYSPYTVQAERAALRLFFSNRTLAAAVKPPARRREQITRSRGPAKHDSHFNLANWQPLIRFLQATGLRRREVRDLRVSDIRQAHDGQLQVYIDNGKGGKLRDVPVLSGREQDVFALAQGCAPDEKVFDHIPNHMDVQSYRREYAQALYRQYAPGRELPPAIGRLSQTEYDAVAAQRVSWALGHNRIDVVLRHYLR